jgi:pyruvate/2-oxoacid:ferredoxin oxidoreductase beta subunit/Pyruvate/2-oxoacid:ferredoxin oxidoreductase gamma subunit
MTTLLNTSRPPVFCPGCSHEKVVHGLDLALQALDLRGEDVAIVSDIGCSGLFDTFFNTHAFHGLHGRALTYATGLKMARPELTVIVVMGDGGLGIGGAHVLSSCRRNMDLTLLILNNFNYGMTGGQCSATTPVEAKTTSNFLNQLEKPLDICRVADAAGAPYIDRTMASDKELSAQLAAAIRYPGFSLMDIWGVCPGRYLKRNRITLAQLEEDMDSITGKRGAIAANEREEYSAHYRRLAAESRPIGEIPRIAAICEAPAFNKRSEVLILGAAGQYINTAGEILCLAGMSGGLHVTQKNDYPITVLRGHSVSEVVLDRKPIGYTGISKPSIILCLAAEGIARKKDIFRSLGQDTLVIKGSDLALPETGAKVIDVDFAGLNIKASQRALAALASLAVLTGEGSVLNKQMLLAGISHRYHGKMLEEAMAVAAIIFEYIKQDK